MDPRARVGDADREETVAALQRYVADGYLSLDEFSDRSAAAYRATSYGELAAVTEDLAPRADAPAAGPRRRRGAAARIGDPRSWSPVVVVVVVLVGVLVLAAAGMAVMMLGLMGGMDMGDMGGMR